MSAPADDLAMFEQDEQLLEMFVSNAAELLDQIESDLLEIEQLGENVDDDLINKVFRSAHTIKGESGFVGLHNLGELAHSIENVLDAIREHEIVPTGEIVSKLLDAFDQLRTMVSDVDASHTTDITGCVTCMQGILNPSDAEPAPESVVAVQEAPEQSESIASSPSVAEEETAGQSADVVNNSAPTERAPILVIEDDNLYSKLIGHELDADGKLCDIAVDGESALELMRKNYYRVILCDINLPGVNGDELIPQLKEISPMVQVIMLTGDASVSNVVACLGAGAIDFLSKTDARGHKHIVRSVSTALDRAEEWLSYLRRK